MSEWITDPAALETIFALGVEVGDEVLIVPPPNEVDSVSNWPATVLKESEVVGLLPDHGGFEVACPCCKGEEVLFITLKQLRGWRRPTKKAG